jgi:hypothetical protein
MQRCSTVARSRGDPLQGASHIEATAFDVGPQAALGLKGLTDSQVIERGVPFVAPFKPKDIVIVLHSQAFDNYIKKSNEATSEQFSIHREPTEKHLDGDALARRQKVKRPQHALAIVMLCEISRVS